MYRIEVVLPEEDALKLIEASAPLQPCDVVHSLIISFIEGAARFEANPDSQPGVASNVRPALN